MLTALLDFAADLGYDQTHRNFTEIFVEKIEIILKCGAKGFMVNDQGNFFHVLKIVGLRKAGGKSHVSGFLSN